MNVRRLLGQGLTGTRVVGLLVAVSLLALMFAWDRAAAPPAETALTEEAADAYLSVALEVRMARRDARLAGWEPARWQEWPALKAALDRVGFTMADYVRVEGQVAAARLWITDPGLGVDSDDPNSRAVPEAQLRIVRERLDRVVAAQAPLP